MIETTIPQRMNIRRGLNDTTWPLGESLNGPKEPCWVLLPGYSQGQPTDYASGRTGIFISGNNSFDDKVSRPLLPFVSEFFIGTRDYRLIVLRMLEDPVATFCIPSQSADFDFAPQSPSQVYQAARVLQIKSPADPALDLLDVAMQLASLKKLKDGWADGMQPACQWGNGYGKAPSPDGLDWLAIQFDSHTVLPNPYIYPTPEGGVQVEWSVGPNEASLEIDLASHSAEWHCLNLETDVSSERDLDLNCPDSWRWVALEVGELERNA